jgi:hypothetical protein
MMELLAPKLAEQLQSAVAQLTQIRDQMQQMDVDVKKHMADLAWQMLLRELYEDPPGAPPGWWRQKRGSPMNPQD